MQKFEDKSIFNFVLGVMLIFLSVGKVVCTKNLNSGDIQLFFMGLVAALVSVRAFLASTKNGHFM